MAPLILTGRSLTPQSVKKVAFGEKVEIEVATRAQGLGSPLTAPQARAVIVTRLDTLLSGAAGASPSLADYLVSWTPCGQGNGRRSAR